MGHQAKAQAPEEAQEVTKGERSRDKARVKALLAEMGQSLNPTARVSYVERPPAGQGASVIVLDRVVKNQLPEYCTHGYAECVRCYHLCWLGDRTRQIVASGEALPLCRECATEVIPPGSVPMRDRTQIRDHRRADGPH